MLHVDFEKIKDRYQQFWALENTDQPIMRLYAPSDKNLPAPIAPDTLEERWTDVDYVVKRTRWRMENRYCCGDMYPGTYPNLGPDLTGAILGCDLSFGEDTTWAHPFIKDWAQAEQVTLDTNNKWYKKLAELTTALVEDSKGDYVVGYTDMHGGLDLLVSMRGPEEMCMDLYDYPDEVKKYTFKYWEFVKQIYNAQYDIISKNLPGTASWMEIWHPGRSYITSCDMAYLMSTEHFDEFILPELLVECDYFDQNIFHLDGIGSFKHLDRLLSIPKIGGIQWVQGAGAPSASHWIAEYKKIQAAKKTLVVNAEPDEIPFLMQHLRPEGLCITAGCSSQQEADDLIAITKKWGK